MKYIKYKPSQLVQGGLKIPIEVPVEWKDIGAIEILRGMIEEASYMYPLGETDQYEDQSKDNFNSNKEELSESDSNSGAMSR